MISSYDFFILIIFTIIISIIFGFIINNKLNNISINLPPFPQPIITLNFDKNNTVSCVSSDFSIKNTLIEKNTPIENFTSLNNPSINNPSINIPSINIPSINIPSINNYSNNNSSINNPSINNYYNNNSSNNNSSNNNFSKIEPNKPINIPNICKNDFVYKNNSYKFINGNTDIDYNNIIIDNEQNIDLNDYYKNNISLIKSYLEDPKMRGYNIFASENYSNLNNIGRIDLTTKIVYPSEFSTVDSLKIPIHIETSSI